MNLMERLRLVTLSILFAGSAAIVYAAVILVNAASANGIPVAQAASANAPVFLEFSRGILISSIILFVCEWGHYRRNKEIRRADYARYVASFLCFVCTIIFSIAIVPNMEKVRPLMYQDAQAFQEFTRLHKVSRVVFGGTILFAFVSLILTDIPHRLKE
jgi:cytosine/uracil/thiamine/allantoin permease